MMVAALIASFDCRRRWGRLRRSHAAFSQPTRARAAAYGYGPLRRELQQSCAIAQLARATRLLATRTRSCGREALDNSPGGLNNSRPRGHLSPADFTAGLLGKVQLMREFLRCAAACRGSRTTTDAFLRRGHPNGAVYRKRHAFRRAKFK